MKCSQITRHFEDDETIRPYLTTTDFLYTCKKCNKIKTVRLEGGWEFRKDDDDNGDDDRDYTPKIPDDFYDLMERK